MRACNPMASNIGPGTPSSVPDATRSEHPATSAYRPRYYLARWIGRRSERERIATIRHRRGHDTLSRPCFSASPTTKRQGRPGICIVPRVWHATTRTTSFRESSLITTGDENLEKAFVPSIERIWSSLRIIDLFVDFLSDFFFCLITFYLLSKSNYYIGNESIANKRDESRINRESVTDREFRNW